MNLREQTKQIIQVYFAVAVNVAVKTGARFTDFITVFHRTRRIAHDTATCTAGLLPVAENTIVAERIEAHVVAIFVGRVAKIKRTLDTVVAIDLLAPLAPDKRVANLHTVTE